VSGALGLKVGTSWLASSRLEPYQPAAARAAIAKVGKRSIKYPVMITDHCQSVFYILLNLRNAQRRANLSSPFDAEMLKTLSFRGFRPPHTY